MEDKKASEQGLIDKQALIAKLDTIPVETLRSILTNQVDLEIRLKHKELRLTEEELGKCEAQMLALRQFFDVPSTISFQNEPSDFTLKYYDVLNKSLSVNYTRLQQQQYHTQPAFNENVFDAEPVHTYRTRSTTSSLRPSFGLSVRIPGCLYRRTDGVVVKLTCPDCHRSNFLSAQGFLNHSRIAHSKEYTSQDAAALQCGEILPDEYQDEEGRASVTALTGKGLDAARNLNITEMYFNGLSKTLNTVHRAETEKNDQLMKKLIRSGVAHDAAEYEALVGEYRLEVANLHLFNDEEEDELARRRESKGRVEKEKGKGLGRMVESSGTNSTGTMSNGAKATDIIGTKGRGDISAKGKGVTSERVTSTATGGDSVVNTERTNGTDANLPISATASRTKGGSKSGTKITKYRAPGDGPHSAVPNTNADNSTTKAADATNTANISDGRKAVRTPANTSTVEPKHDGGMYENRLRRRRSRVTTEIPKLHIDDDDKRTKRRKSQR